MNEKRDLRRVKDCDAKTSKCRRINLEGNINQRPTVLSGSLGKVFSSQVQNKYKSAKGNTLHKLEKYYKGLRRSQRIKSKVNSSPHVIHKNKSKSIIKEINDKFYKLSRRNSEILFNNQEATFQESFDENINKPKQKSIFKEINERYNKLTAGFNKPTQFGANKLLIELNRIHENESGCTKSTFCDILREQGKKQMELNEMHDKVEHHSARSQTGTLISPSKWIFITPPKQRLPPSQLEGSAIETGIICIQKNEKQLFELKPSYKNCSFKSSKNKVTIDNKFNQLGSFVHDSGGQSYNVNTPKSHETSILYSNKGIEREGPSTSQIIRRPKKPYFTQKLNKNENCLKDLDKIKMDIADINLDSTFEGFSTIEENDDIEMHYSDKYKRKHSEDFVIKKKSRKFFSFNRQPVNIFQFNNKD
ncbi:hypothetical protein GWI33_010537 [Rhynchophorus ferrugineus]|uniref:Uncharacterized protein n=1 Tax=Rhynchophorus ferrugineus TaxID=354439 RepID=A0A834MM99_RHYFE|nr:hypothetical protein GWI33_010537 [Rhynchophorus ferrugineus]